VDGSRKTRNGEVLAGFSRKSIYAAFKEVKEFDFGDETIVCLKEMVGLSGRGGLPHSSPLFRIPSAYMVEMLRSVQNVLKLVEQEVTSRCCSESL
jgi:hypothetical protein